MKIRYLLCSALFALVLSACDESNKTKTVVTQAKEFDLEKQKAAYQLTRFKVLDISESPYDNGPALAVAFSVPLDTRKNIQQHLQVLDEKKQVVSGAWVLNNTRTRAYFQYIEPSLTYEVIVKAAITSINSQQLPSKIDALITTSHLPNSVRFVNKGEILPSKLTRGLPVESVNIKDVDINFHRINEDKILEILSYRLSRYNYFISDLPKYGELAYTSRYQLDYEKNKKRTTILPIHKIKELNKPGYYIAVMRVAGEYPYEQQITSFYISNLALTVTNYNLGRDSNQVEVHTLSIDQGKSLTDVELTLVNKDAKVVASAKTDNQGNHIFTNVDNESLIIARLGNDFSVISLTSPALDLSEQLSITRKQQEQELFLYGPRDLYRPGETIYINGILRDHDGQPLPSVPLEAKLLRPDGRIASSFSWHPKSTGFYSKELNVSKSDPTGEWTLEVTHPGASKFRYAFSIEEFMPETMKLELKSEADEFADKKMDIKISGQGDYLYGSPAAENKISARITVKPNHFPIEKLKDYYFGRATKSEENINTELNDKNLDSQGKVSWLLPNLWHEVKFPTQVVFEASLFESGGRPVTRRVKQNIWVGQHQIGLRPLYKEKIVTPFSQAEFELINADKDASLLPLGELEISLIREDTEYFWRENNNAWDFGATEKESRVYSRVLNAKDDRISIQLPVEYGNYRLEISDNQGQLKNSYKFFAGWDWDEQGESGAAGARPDKVRIQFDQESYAANQTAKVTLISPHLGRALIRVESNKILWEKQLELTSLEQAFELEIPADWSRHDLYITAMVVSPSKNQPLSDNKLAQLPKRALGVQALILDRKERRLSVNIATPEVVEPEQSIEIKLSLDTPVKTGQATWVTLAAVDTGVLSLSGYKTPDPFDWFYGQRAYTGNIRDSFSHLIKNQEGKLGVQKFGGDAELTRGGEQPATDVQVVSLFSKAVQFDDKGQAIVVLDLPNFNGELRLMAVAFSGDQFASHESFMKVRAPLIAEMATPRFLANKDKTNIAFDLKNLSGQEQSLIANIQFSGAIASNSSSNASSDNLANDSSDNHTDKQSVSVTLKDGEKHIQKFAIIAKRIGAGKVDLELTDAQGKIKLSRSWSINVRAAYPAKFVRHRKVLQQGESFELSKSLTKDFEQNSLQAKIMLSSTPPLDSANHLQGLLQYPYGCLEQTSSRAWPLLNYQSFSQPIKLGKQEQKILAEKNKHIAAAIQRINGMQKSNGSFALWSNQGQEEQWLTVYALDFLLQAKAAGYSVPQSVIDSALGRISSYVSEVEQSYEEMVRYSKSAKHYGLAFRAYAAYLLSKNRKITLGELRQINDSLSEHTRSGLPLAHLAIAFENAGDNKTAIKLWNKAIKFKRYSKDYFGDYGSPLRDTAWVMMLATESRLKVDYQDLIYAINDKMLSKQWYSTQERFAIYRLALALDKAVQDDWTVKMTSKQGLNKTINNQKTYGQWLTAQLFKQNTALKLTKGKSLFVDLQLVGYPLVAPKKMSKGINSTKQFYTLQGQPTSLTKVKSGDYVLVRINIASTTTIPDAMVVDLIPAGFELENPGLEFSQSLSNIYVEGNTVSEWLYQSQIKHSEYRDDRFISALTLNEGQPSVLFYLMRAVTPGVYQVPPTQVEDMYRPYLRSLSTTIKPVTVTER